MRNPVIFVAYMAHLIYIYTTHAGFLGWGVDYRVYKL